VGISKIKERTPEKEKKYQKSPRLKRRKKNGAERSSISNQALLKAKKKAIAQSDKSRKGGRKKKKLEDHHGDWHSTKGQEKKKKRKEKNEGRLRRAEVNSCQERKRQPATAQGVGHHTHQTYKEKLIIQKNNLAAWNRMETDWENETSKKK